MVAGAHAGVVRGPRRALVGGGGRRIGRRRAIGLRRGGQAGGEQSGEGDAAEKMSHLRILSWSHGGSPAKRGSVVT